MQENAIEALKKLHTAAIDARNGYQEALNDAKGHGLSGLFAEMVDLHTGNADELRQALARVGVHAHENGSFMSVVHETIMDVRSLFGGLGSSVLPGLIDGEQRNVAAYDKALEEDPDPRGPFSSLVLRQRDRLRAKLVAMKAERDDLKGAAQ
jgi:uncharacterized protein (TIGR02284 family)